VTTAAETHTPSTGCYKRGCKQPGCVAAGRRYAKLLAYDMARGISRMHDTTQVRAHVERLVAAKWTHREIGNAAHVARATISYIAAGQPETSKRIALAILSIPIGPPPKTPTHTEAVGSTRRIRALAFAGYTLVDLAGRLNMSDDRVSSIARGAVSVVRTSDAQLIARTYRQLADKPGPSERARADARKKGWAPLGVWDDIDDPDAVPDWTGHCGSDRGYWMHQRQQLPMCQRCKQAHEAWLEEHAHLSMQELNQERFRARAAATTREADLAHDARELMRVSGLSVEQAAERLDVTRPHLHQALKRHPAPAKAGPAKPQLAKAA
jgi:transcriptional regulator with XRE-family HTH domain/plasmid maintenance system antidote protein VapI